MTRQSFIAAVWSGARVVPECDAAGNVVGLRAVVGEVHVDWDAPNVIRTGPDSFLLLPDPAAEPVEPVPLGDGWVDVGFLTEDDL